MKMTNRFLIVIVALLLIGCDDETNTWKMSELAVIGGTPTAYLYNTKTGEVKFVYEKAKIQDGTYQQLEGSNIDYRQMLIANLKDKGEYNLKNLKFKYYPGVSDLKKIYDHIIDLGLTPNDLNGEDLYNVEGFYLDYKELEEKGVIGGDYHVNCDFLKNAIIQLSKYNFSASPLAKVGTQRCQEKKK